MSPAPSKERDAGRRRCGMSLKRQFQIKMKQKGKRKKARRKLLAKSQNPNEYFYGKYYIKLGESR